MYNGVFLIYMDMKFNFSNNIVLITGGGTDALGRSVVKSFLESNCKTIIVTYMQEKGKIDLEKEIKELQQKSIIEFIRSDITKEYQVKSLISEIIQKYKKIDVVVNVVGAYIGGKKVQELNEDEWDKMMDINLKSNICLSDN